MATHVSYRDGGKTGEEGFYRPFRKLLSRVGVMSSTDLLVTERGAGANKSVDIAAGDAFFSYNNYAFYGWNTAVLNSSDTVIADNTSGNPRIDAVVAYIDLTVVSSASSDNPGALKFKVVQGTPAGSPSAPNDAAIQSSVGAGNPFLRLANVAVANGFTSIVNANITDTRTVATVLGFESPKRCRVYKDANQSINNGAVTVLSFNQETFDTDTMHDNVTNNSRITINTPGVYLIKGQVSFASNTTGLRQILLHKNGTGLYASASAAPANGDRTTHQISAIVQAAAADYFELAANQTSGGALNIEGVAGDLYYGTNFEAVRLGPSS